MLAKIFSNALSARQFAASVMLGALLALLLEPTKGNQRSAQLKDGDKNSATVNAVVPAKSFSIGSTKTEVMRAMGRPENSFAATKWIYGNSIVYFYGNLVEGFKNSSSSNYNLKISMAPSATLHGKVAVGSTKRQVLTTYGTPVEVQTASWIYPNLKVDFDNNGEVSKLQRLKSTKSSK